MNQPPPDTATSPTSQEVNALEDRCDRVKEIIQDFASPWFVEFAGMPLAGKSNCISTVEHFLRRNDFSVLAPREGATTVPELIKDNCLIAYNVWTATYAIRQILDGRFYKGPQKYDVVLLDRGLFDATAWFHVLEDDKKLNEEERKYMTKFVRVKHWKAVVQQVFLFLCNPATSIKRELNGKLTAKTGLVTNQKFLTMLHKVYEDNANCYKDEFNIMKIETDSANQKRVAFWVIKQIFKEVETKLK